MPSKKEKRNDSGALVPNIKSTYPEKIGAKSENKAILDQLINVIAPYCSYATLVAFSSADRKHQQVISDFLMQGISLLAAELNRRTVAAFAKRAPLSFSEKAAQKLKKITSSKDEITSNEINQAKSQCHVAMQLLHSMEQQNKNKKIAIDEQQKAEVTTAITGAETAFITWFEKPETRVMLRTITKTPAGLTYLENTMTEFYLLAADSDSKAILMKLHQFLFGVRGNDLHMGTDYYPVVAQNILEKIQSSNSSDSADSTTWFDVKLSSHSFSVDPILRLLKTVFAFLHVRYIVDDHSCHDWPGLRGYGLMHVNGTDETTRTESDSEYLGESIRKFRAIFQHWVITKNIRALQSISGSVMSFFADTRGMRLGGLEAVFDKDC